MPTLTPAEPANILSDLISDEEFCNELGIHHRTLKRWDALGDAPPIVKIGRRAFRRRSAIPAWIAAHEQQKTRGGRQS